MLVDKIQALPLKSRQIFVRALIGFMWGYYAVWTATTGGQLVLANMGFSTIWPLTACTAFLSIQFFVSALVKARTKGEDSAKS